MKTLKSLATLMLCLLLATGISIFLNSKSAKTENVKNVCTNTSLSGAYKTLGAGYLNYTDPYALTSLNNFDGNGNIKGTILARSIAGNITTNLGTQGTYQVKSDCSFTVSYIRTDGTTSNYIGTVIDDGNKFSYTQTDPGTIVSVQGERVKTHYPFH